MKGLGVSGRLISGRDFRYEKFSRAMRALPSINIICPPISEILPTPLHTVDLIQLSHCLCWVMGLSLVKELRRDLGQSYLKEARCFLKYTVPMRRIKLRNPGSRVASHVSARLPIDVVLMNSAC